MIYDNIIYEKRGGIGLVTINRPEQLNPLNAEVFRELRDVFMVMDHDREIRCVVITGAGRAFVAGADIAAEHVQTDREEYAFLCMGHEVMNAIENFRAPVIAAINGYALGGGLELALACDIRIAAESAKMGVPEINLSSFPSLGGTRRLPAAVGLARAKELIFTGRHVRANQAYEYRLVQEVVPDAELMDTVLAMAGQIAARSPLALEYGKRAVSAG